MRLTCQVGGVEKRRPEAGAAERVTGSIIETIVPVSIAIIKPCRLSKADLGDMTGIRKGIFQLRHEPWR
jgi:hypothetical protein